jgi:hypothetical protein
MISLNDEEETPERDESRLWDDLGACLRGPGRFAVCGRIRAACGSTRQSIIPSELRLFSLNSAPNKLSEQFVLTPLNLNESASREGTCQDSCGRGTV